MIPTPEPALAGEPLAALRRRSLVVLRWIVLWALLLAALIAPFLLFEPQLARWLATAFAATSDHPWLGAGLVIALLAGDCLLPVPSSLVSAFAGGAFGWALGSLVIWTGMTLGCVAGYALGASAGRILALPLVGDGELARARRLFTDVGPAALIVTRGVPVLAEAGALASGAARMPFGAFMVATSVANAGLAIAYAATGAAAASTGSFLIVFLGLAAIPALGWTAWRLSKTRRNRTL